MHNTKSDRYYVVYKTLLRVPIRVTRSRALIAGEEIVCVTPAGNTTLEETVLRRPNNKWFVLTLKLPNGSKFDGPF